MGGTLMSDVWTALVCAAVAERGTAEARVRLSGKDTGEMVCVDAAQGETRIVRKGWVFSILLLVFPFQSHFFFSSWPGYKENKNMKILTFLQRFGGSV